MKRRYATVEFNRSAYLLVIVTYCDRTAVGQSTKARSYRAFVETALCLRRVLA